MSTLLQTAISMAAALHQGQQRMSGEAFITHPLATLDLLQQAGVRDGEILLAAVLHDTLEELETLEERRAAARSIERVCGTDVALMVRSLTKDDAHTLYPPDVREQRYVERILRHARIHPGIVLVKLADRLHNILTVEALPQERRERVLQETYTLYLPFFTESLSLMPQRHQEAYLLLLNWLESAM